MATLAPSYLPAEPARRTAAALSLLPGQPRQSGALRGPVAFVILSAASHALIFATVGQHTPAAAADWEPPIEVEMIWSAPEPEPVPETLPEGRLEAPPVRAAPVVPAAAVVPRSSAPSHSNVAAPKPADEAPAAQATKILTSSDDNPYASASAGMFVSGEGRSPGHGLVTSRKVVQVAAPAARFGVEGGSGEGSEERRQALSAWYASVRARLAHLALQRYPMKARKLGQEGTVKIAVRIADTGRVLGASVSSASGFSSLDQAALQGVDSLSTVDAPPTGTGATTVVVGVTYRLN